MSCELCSCRYQAVKPNDLWVAFDNVLFELTESNLYGQNVHTVMSTWTEQVGYPVVNVAKEGNSLFLSQVKRIIAIIVISSRRCCLLIF